MRPLLLATAAGLLAASAAHAAPAPAAGVTGTVLAADGTPAAAAAVWAARHDWGPLVRRETRADNNGRFTFDLGPGKWFVWARREGQGGEMENLDVAVGSARDLTIRMADRGTLRGRLVAAESGQPIAGGRLCLDNGDILTTDADGRFNTGGLKRKEHESFVVAPGRARIRVLFDTTAAADTELEIPVRPAGRIVGRVLDQDGKPIPGAAVGRHTSGSFFSTNALFERCDADGRFVYDGIAIDSPARLSAESAGYDDHEKDGLLVTDPARPLSVEFRLSCRAAAGAAAVPGVTARRAVTGTIRGPEGKPLAGALVRWGPLATSASIEARTAADGSFRLADVPDEAGVLAVMAADLAPAFPEVPAGGDQLVETRLPSGRSATGIVVDDGGKPLAGVHVSALTTSPEPRDHQRVMGGTVWLDGHSARTDDAGRFSLKGLPDNATGYFSRDGLNDIRGMGLSLDGAENRVVMEFGGAIRGRVVDAAGKPVRNFRVLINIPHGNGPGERVGGYFAGYCGTGVRFTSADGTFTLTGLNPGHVHRVGIVADGLGGAEENRVESAPLNRLPPAEKLTFRVAASAVRVRAVTADGKPVAGARVTLVNGDRPLDLNFMWGYHDAGWEDTVRRRTGDDGWADFRGLPFAGATVLVQAPGFARQHVGWRKNEAELTVELAPEAVLTVTVGDAAGRPPREFHVNLTSGGDQITGRGGPDDQGQVRLAELPAGDWHLTIRDADGNRTLYEGQVTLKPGESATRTIDAPPRAGP
jgi:hypothetical protein